MPEDWKKDLHHKILAALRAAMQARKDHPERDNELRAVVNDINEAAFMMEAIRDDARED